MEMKQIIGYFLIIGTFAFVIWTMADSIGWWNTFKVMAMSIGMTSAIALGVYLI